MNLAGFLDPAPKKLRWDGTVEGEEGRKTVEVGERDRVEVFCDICDQLYVNKCVVRVSVLSTFPSGVRKFISGQPKLAPTLRIFFHEWSDR